MVKDIPENNKSVRIFYDSCWGEYSVIATCKHYKPGSSKGQLRSVYRFVLDDGSIMTRREVDRVEEI